MSGLVKGVPSTAVGAAAGAIGSIVIITIVSTTLYCRTYTYNCKVGTKYQPLVNVNVHIFPTSDPQYSTVDVPRACATSAFKWPHPYALKYGAPVPNPNLIQNLHAS